jgi:hypothetical protein
VVSNDCGIFSNNDVTYRCHGSEVKLIIRRWTAIVDYSQTMV